MKIIVDRTKCTGLGLCESLAPDLFEVDEDGDLLVLSDQVTADLLSDAEAAVTGCPTLALRLES